LSPEIRTIVEADPVPGGEGNMCAARQPAGHAAPGSDGSGAHARGLPKEPGRPTGLRR